LIVASGTSLSAPFVTALLANIIGIEKLYKDDKDVDQAVARLLDNAQRDLIGNMPPNSLNLLANTGRQHPHRRSDQPYKMELTWFHDPHESWSKDRC
jgi:hypothetical protein